MKIVLRTLGVIVLLIILGMAACIPLASSPRPVASALPGAALKADSMARTMERAINKAAWDSTVFVRWNFLGQHDHLWDRPNNRARVQWGSYTVYLDAATGKGKAWKKGTELSSEELDEALTKAIDYFFNDSFWLNAPAKAFDGGVERSVSTGKDDQLVLVLEYVSGGVTPGDVYQWTLDANGLPERWNMWVQVLPIKGLGNTWEGWETLYSGARIATVHGAGPFNIRMIRDLASAASLPDMQEPDDAMAAWRFGL